MTTNLRPIILQDQAEPASPPAGSVALYSVDGTALLLKDSDGTVRTLGAGGSGDMVLASAQTVTGIKTFADGTLLMRDAGDTFSAEPYSDANPPETITFTDFASGSVVTPAAGFSTLHTPDGRVLYLKDSDAVVRPVDMSWENAQFSKGGVLTTGVGAFRFPIKGGTFQIQTVAAMVGTAPTGATQLAVDVNKNGTTIYGTQGNRPIWTASANAATVSAHTATTVTDGDYLTVDIDAVGSTVAGSNLVVVVRMQRIT
jgi:hypothetical protein